MQITQNHMISSFLLAILCLPTIQAKTYQIGLVEWMPWITAHVAKEQGYWHEQGLEIKVRQFANYDNENLPSFRYGRIDFAVVMLGNAVEIISKAPERYKIIYEHDWSHGGDLFVLSKRFQKTSELKGQRIALYSKSAPVNFFLHKILTQHEISMNEVKTIEIANTKHLNQSFRHQRFAAIVNFDPEASKVVKDGSGQLMYSSADFPGVIPEGLVVQSRVLRDNPEDVRKFLHGWLKALQWQTDPNNAVAFLDLAKKTMFRNSSYSDAELQAFMQGGKIHQTREQMLVRNQQGVQQYVTEMLNFLRTQQSIPNHPIDTYVDTRIAVEEIKKLWSAAKP